MATTTAATQGHPGAPRRTTLLSAWARRGRLMLRIRATDGGREEVLQCSAAAAALKELLAAAEQCLQPAGSGDAELGVGD